MGTNGYLTILEELKTETPIVAIGGITLEDVPEIMTTGVHGIAVSGEATKDFNKINTFYQILKGEDKLEQRFDKKY